MTGMHHDQYPDAEWQSLQTSSVEVFLLFVCGNQIEEMGRNRLLTRSVILIHSEGSRAWHSNTENLCYSEPNAQKFTGRNLLTQCES